ncbi:M1 family metallopeptidase [Aggregicoccus sp. 17bor-14]|uniref:M1 family metallopeptidase n=1 Tax=Myxococcaceae TaxID=31 RepID=UPI00129C11F1|nr:MULTISPECIES: M1 family metallopeptidase [Myxococcaceae]MBF5041092.1 M1 family metallopeptidase [Simulacricoccus sp. 17bor-14]MRI86879.1 M1 family metallopeptidase [Aggregicoccus sp. 17bor-14]
MRAHLALLFVLLPSLAAASRLPETVVPEHYTLSLAPDMATGALEGKETVRLRIAKPTRSVVLNAVGLTLRDVAVTAGGQRQQGSVKVDAAAETVTLSFPKALAAGEAELSLAFSGRVRDDLRGLYFSKSPRRKYLATQLEATYARMVFPCFDAPAFKATFDLSVVADAGDTVISNGKLVKDEPGPQAGKHTLTFSTSPRMSTYLVAIAAGDFQCLEGESDGTPLRVCAVPEKVQMGRTALELTRTFIPFFNRYFGIRYPFGKLDQVAMPDYEWGGMENTGAIFYKERALLRDEKTMTVSAKRGLASVVAHEMAHQWFGDLVTTRWWNNIWLNEGFATWMARKPVQAWDPKWDQALEAALDAAGVAEVDSLSTTRPILANGETPGEIKELFDGIAYQKGAAVLGMLEAYLGPDTFRDGVRAYLARYQNGNATAEDLWTELTRVSKKPVDRIMKSYVTQAGLPRIAVRNRCEGDRTKVTLRQQRFLSNPGSAPKGASAELWQVPVCLRSGKEGAPQCELLRQREQTFSVQGCHPWVFANAGASGFYRTRYAPEALRALSGEVMSALSPAERIVLLQDQWALVLAGDGEVSEVLQLAAGMEAERRRAVWEVLLERIGFVGEYLVAPAQRPAFDRWVRARVTPALNELGWEPKPGEPDDARDLRARLFGALAGAGDEAAIARARALTQQAMKAPASLDPSLAGVAVGIAARYGDAALFEAFQAQQQRAGSPEEAFRYLMALTRFRDPALVERAVALLRSPTLRSQDLPSYTGALLSNPASRDQAWAAMKADWARLSSQVTSFGGGGAVGALGAFCDAAAARDIEGFFASHPAPGAERTLKRSLESISQCAALKARQQAPLARWLDTASP